MQRWAGADASDAPSVFLPGNLRKQMTDFAAQIGRHALQPANRHRLAIIQSATPAGRLTGTVAGPAQDRRKYVRLPIEHVGIGVAALRDQPDVLRDVGMSRASPLAIHYFVEVVRIAEKL